MKPCPFCAGPAEPVFPEFGADYFFTYIACLLCGATGPGRQTLEEAKAAWDERPQT